MLTPSISVVTIADGTYTINNVEAGSTFQLTAQTSNGSSIAPATTITMPPVDNYTLSKTLTFSINSANENTVPVANAGSAQSVSTGTVVALNGSSSSDVNGDSLTYKWSFTSKPVGSNAALSSITAIKPTFIADVAGLYMLNLVVNDGKVDSIAATVSISAVAASPFEVKYSVKGSGTGSSTCYLNGTIGIGNYFYNFSNCLMYATAGSPLVASIYNNTDKSYNIISLTIDFASGIDIYGLSPAGTVLLPHSGIVSNVLMPTSNELTQSKAIFKLSEIGDVSGNFGLLAIQ